MTSRPPASREALAHHLRALGVAPGGCLLVHTSLSRIGPVDGGPDAVIDVLCELLGPEGTLVMPSMTDDDEQPFDVAHTSCRGMGIVADTFWRRAGVLRSDSPHAFAAVGRHASAIVAPHPVHVPHGIDSPVGRVYALDGRILLLGVGHDANTTIHLAESLAPVRYRVAKWLSVWQDGVVTRLDYEETDHCCQRFALLDGWLEQAGLQRRAIVGHGEGRLMRSGDVVATAVAHLRADDTVFLHPPGVDEECDAARASLTRVSPHR